VSGDRFEVRARRVVLTAPPQLVAEIDFTPTLPSARKRTLSQLKMGAVVKSALLYERPFWRDQGLSGEMWSDLGPLTGTYDTTEPGCAQGLLTGLATGPHAAALGAMTAEARRQHILAGLVPHFGERAASPLEYRDQVWSAEVWTRGGYAAHLGAGQFTPAYRSLHEPVGVLHWAGTETAAAWPGYMEGAIESSERVVRELTSTVA
jgi:monoamine oxidase